MRNIEKMVAERKALIAEMRSITEKAAERENKALTDAEDKRFKELNILADASKSEIEKEMREQAEAARTATSPSSLYGGGGFGSKPIVGKDYRSIFHAGSTGALSDGGFKNADEFFRVAGSGKYDARLDLLNEKRQQQTGIGSLGGFSCPEILSQIILDRSLESEIVRPRATLWPLTTQTQKVPIFDTQDTTSDVGGLQGVWMNELGTSTNLEAVLRQLDLKLKKLGVFAAASREILTFGSGGNFGENLMNMMAKVIAYYQDVAYFSGSGAGEPVGIINHVSTIAVPRQTAGSIEFDDIVNLMAQLLPGSFSNAVWVCSQTGLASLMSVASRITVGAGGSYVPLLQQIGDKFTLLGRELVFSERVPILGLRGDIGLYDFSKYYIGIYKDVILESSNAPGFSVDRTDFRAILLVDGQPVFSQQLVQRQGNTVSPFVVLDSETTTTVAP